MASVVEIYNMALGNAGITKVVASVDEKSVEAIACKRFYDQVIFESFREFPWPFAKRIIKLALVAEQPNAVWGFSYRYPSSCARLVRVIPSDIAVDDNYRDAYSLSSDSSGKLIMSNQVSASAEYVHHVTDPTLYDANFVNMVSWALASKIAPGLTANNAKSVIQRADSMIMSAKNRAEAEALNEINPDTSPYCETIASRD